MGDVIEIHDLGAPVLNDVQRMAIDYGESRTTVLTVDAVCDAARRRTGLADFGDEDFAERLGLQLAEMDADEERTGHRAAHDVRGLRPSRRQPSSAPRPAEPASRDPRGPHHAAGHRGRAAAFGDHPPRQPAGRGHPVPLDAPVGVLRAGPDPGEPSQVDGVDPRWNRCQGTWEAHAGGSAAGGGHAPDGARPRPRGDRAADARLLELHARVGGPGATLAGPLPGPRPDPALRLHEVGAPDSAVVPAPRSAGSSSHRSTSSNSARCSPRSPTPPSW